MDASRVMVFSPSDAFEYEIVPNDMMSCYEYEEINGQHYLEIVTTAVLKKEQRILTTDEMGKRREYVVSVEDASHANGDKPFGKYKCPWSLQHDATLWKVSRMVGTTTPVSAHSALEAALSGTERWSVGTVTQLTEGGASMYQMSGWEALSVVVGTWGGEVDAHIEVGQTGIVSRSVNLYSSMGEQTAKRRFDYSYDLTSVTRTVGESPVACRIIPRGKGEQIGDGYGRKITIESVNDGIEWLQNDESAELFKMPDGQGGWEYPIVYVDNPDIEDPQELKDWGLSVLNEHTVPQVTYSLEVVQLGIAGEDVHGVSLGDAVQCVDKEFGDTPLRIEARVISIKRNKILPNMISVTIGNVRSRSTIGSNLAKVLGEVKTLNSRSVSTAEFLDNLIENVNAQINAQGGYWYAVRGQGTRTYDTEVSDPLVGEEANAVVEMRGGTIRIADSRTTQGEWDWRSVFQAGRVATEMVVGGNIVTGFIRNSDGSFYVDLDSKIVNIGSNPMMGDSYLQDALDDARRQATDYIRLEGGEVIFGTADGAVKNVIGATKQSYRTDAGDIAWYGLDAVENIWKLFIDNAQVNDTLRFGDFAWIARQNGNMTIKWVGE